jgi:hypothetical protein
MCETYIISDKALATYDHENMYSNIRVKQLKHLKYILTTYVWNICNIHLEQMKYFEQHLWNTCNVPLKHLQYVQHPWSTFVTSIWNNYNVPLKYLQYVQHPWSTFAISIWNNCNIPLKRLKHLKHTLATCASIATSPYWSRASRWLRRRSCVFFSNTQKSSVVHVYIRAPKFCFALAPKNSGPALNIHHLFGSQLLILDANYYH